MGKRARSTAAAATTQVAAAAAAAVTAAEPTTLSIDPAGLVLISLKLGNSSVDAFVRLAAPRSRDVLVVVRGTSADRVSPSAWLAAFPPGSAVRVVDRGACVGALRGMQYVRLAFCSETAASDVLCLPPMPASGAADGAACGLRCESSLPSFSLFRSNLPGKSLLLLILLC